MLEKDFRKKFVAFVKTLPNTHYMSVTQAIRRGDPDIVLCVNGRYVGCELKNEIGKATPLQIEIGKKITHARGYFMIVRPQNFNEVKVLLKELAQGVPHEHKTIA